MPRLAGIDYAMADNVVGPLTIGADQMIPAVLFSYSWSAARNVVIDYSIVRDGIIENSKMKISTDGHSISFIIDRTNLKTTGVMFFPVINGDNLEVKYSSDNSGGNADFWYSQRNLLK